MDKSLNEQLVALYQEYYKFEMERKDRLSQLANLPLTILIGLFGFMAYIFGNFPKQGPEYSYIVFLIGLVASSTFLLLSCYYIIRALFGKPYEYLTTPQKIEKFISELVAFNKQQKSKKTQIVYETEILETLRENFSKAVERNQNSNREKSDQILRAIRCTAMSFVLSIVAIVPFLVLKHSRKAEPQEIRITNIGEIKMSNSNKKDGNKTTTIKPQNTAAQKPPRPSNTINVNNSKLPKK